MSQLNSFQCDRCQRVSSAAEWRAAGGACPRCTRPMLSAQHYNCVGCGVLLDPLVTVNNKQCPACGAVN